MARKITWKVHKSIPPVLTTMWLFTIGLCKLTFWQGVFAIIIWPYYIGDLLGRSPWLRP